MLPEWVIKYVGGGLLIVICYVIVSNTLWLILGAKALQLLPGVNDKSAKGTLKIMILIVMSVIGILFWVLKLLPASLGIVKFNSLGQEIGFTIQKGSKLYHKIAKKRN